MNIPTYDHPLDPDYNDPLNCVVPLSDKDIPNEVYDNDTESYCSLCRNEDCDGYCDCSN